MSSRVVGDTFYTDRLVRFSYCDPAGIIFYPQYFVMFNGLVEDWFNQGMGVDYAGFINDHRRGFPMVNLSCDFLVPSKIGEVITLALQVQALGRSSLKLRVAVVFQGQERVRADLVLVTMDLDAGKAVPIPDELRLLMTAFQAGKLDTNSYES